MPRHRFRYSGLLEGIVISFVGLVVFAIILLARGDSAPITETDANSQKTWTTEQFTSGVSSNETLGVVQTPAVVAPTPIVLGTPSADELIPVAAGANVDLTLVRMAELPLLTQEQAIRSIHDLGVPFALSKDWLGQDVTITATYGLATFGYRSHEGAEWVGFRSALLSTGELLDHVERRPMWIIEYNVVFNEDPLLSHTAYAVDALTSTVLWAWGYNVQK